MNKQIEIRPGMWLVWDSMNMSIEEEVENSSNAGVNPYVRRKIAGYSNNLGDLLCSYERNKFMTLDCDTLQDMAMRQIEMHEYIMQILKDWKIKDIDKLKKGKQHE